MEDEVVISLAGISKCFRRYGRPVDRLKEILLPGRSYAGEFWALHDIHLQVHRGETLGIIGKNGSGKSTLLQIIAGTLQPTLGQVSVRGRVSALLELGSGFNPEFTGRQNVFFNGRILGLSQAEIAEKFDAIAAFADIGEFIDQPVKTYSSGMFVRLAFAVAVHVNPDVLIVDEALAVGDGIFVHRCMARIQAFQESGGTILFVSHDVNTVSRLCSRIAWVNGGKLIAIGAPAAITKQYQAWIYDQIHAAQKGEPPPDVAPRVGPGQFDRSDSRQKTPTPPLASCNPFTGKVYQNFLDVNRFGTGRAEIVAFQVFDSQGSPMRFVQPGDELRVVIQAIAFDQIPAPIVGVSIYDRLRTLITGVNTYQLKQKLPPLAAQEKVKVEFTFLWPEIQGANYALETAIAQGSQEDHEMLDWLQCPMNIVSGAIDETSGIVRLSKVTVAYDVDSASSLVS